MTLKAKKEKAEVILGTVSYLKVEKCESAEEGYCNVTVVLEGKSEIREELFYLLAENKIPVFKMIPESHDLESIFLELTGSEYESQDMEISETENKKRITADSDLEKEADQEVKADDSNL